MNYELDQEIKQRANDIVVGGARVVCIGFEFGKAIYALPGRLTTTNHLTAYKVAETLSKMIPLNYEGKVA